MVWSNNNLLVVQCPYQVNAVIETKWLMISFSLKGETDGGSHIQFATDVHDLFVCIDDVFADGEP